MATVTLYSNQLYGVTESTLTSVGVLAGGSIAPGFGDIDIDQHSVTCGTLNAPSGSSLTIASAVQVSNKDFQGIKDLSCVNVAISGNLTVSGTTTSVNTETVEIKDNILLINKDQTGTPPSNLTSGIEVERGDAINYQFMFRESDESFVVGQAGDLQKVATREDSPVTDALAFWNPSTYRFETSASYTKNNIVVSSQLNTTYVTEGSNLYFTNQRAIDALNMTSPSFDALQCASLEIDSKTFAISHNVSFDAAGTVNLTLPTSGTLVTDAGAATLTNKSIDASQLTGIIASARVPEFTGDVYVAEGSTGTTISSGAVSLAKMAPLSAQSLIGNSQNSSTTPSALSSDDVKGMLGLSTSSSPTFSNIQITNEITAASLEIAGHAIEVSGLFQTNSAISFSASGPVSVTLPTSGTIITADSSSMLTNKSIDAAQLTGTIEATRLPALSGDVSSSAGSASVTIANSAVSLAKMANLDPSVLIGNNGVSSGVPLALSVSQVQTMLNVSSTSSPTFSTATISNLLSAGSLVVDGSYVDIAGTLETTGSLKFYCSNATELYLPSSGTVITEDSTSTLTNKSIDAGQLTGSIIADRMPEFTGDVTVTSGTTVTSIANSAVTLAKIANLGGYSIIGNNTGSNHAPLALSVSQVQTMLGVASTSTPTFSGLTVTNDLSTGTLTVNSSSVVFGGNFSTDNALTFTAAGSASLTLPTSGVLITEDSSSILTNKSIDAGQLSGTIVANRLPAFTGDVTTNAGSTSTTIASGAVSLSKLANLAGSTLIGNNSGSSTTPSALSISQVQTMLEVAPTSSPVFDSATITNGLAAGELTVSGYQIVVGGNLSTDNNLTFHSSAASSVTIPTSGTLMTEAGSAIVTNKSIDAGQLTGTVVAARLPAFSGDVTTSSGSSSTTIGNSAVTLAKMSNLDGYTMIGNNTASSSVPLALSVSQVQTMLEVASTSSPTFSSATITNNLSSGTLSVGGSSVSVGGNFQTDNAVSFSSSGSVSLSLPTSGTVVTLDGVGTLTNKTMDASQLDGTIASARMPAFTGDVTSSAGFTSTTIANSAVTLAKMANLSTDGFLGNQTGSAAAPQLLSVGDTLSLLGLESSDSPSFAGLTITLPNTSSKLIVTGSDAGERVAPVQCIGQYAGVGLNFATAVDGTANTRAGLQVYHKDGSYWRTLVDADCWESGPGAVHFYALDSGVSPTSSNRYGMVEVMTLSSGSVSMKGTLDLDGNDLSGVLGIQTSGDGGVVCPASNYAQLSASESAYTKCYGKDYTNASARGGVEVFFDTRNSGAGGYKVMGGSPGSATNYLEVTASGTTAVHGKLSVQGGAVYKTTSQASGTYSVSSSDMIVLAGGSGAVTINLQTASSNAGRFLVVKDAGGNASSQHITIVPNGASLIDNKNDAVINSDYAAFQIICDGSNWFTL